MGSIQFIARLQGTREGWPAHMTAGEQQAMGEHLVYLRNLVHAGRVLLAGPVADPVHGLVVLDVADEDEALRILDSEPSVKAGVHRYTLHPFTATLLHGRDRYAPEPGDRRIEKDVEVEAPRREVWRAWTTDEGLRSFFASDTRVELRVGGPFEILFRPKGEAPEGSRGSEGCRILAFLPEEMLAFSWTAPPSFPDLRGTRTQVILNLEELGPRRTRVRLTNHGYGDGEEWDPVFEYFESAWGYVLENFRRRFAPE